MNWLNFQCNWIDFVLLLVLALGLYRGRKRGMSEEVLDLIKWVLIVITAGHLYHPVGRLLADLTVLSKLTCFVAVYASIILMYQGLFAYIRRAVGQKLVTCDAFGAGEYYMGMMSGAFRYICITIVVLAFLNAPVYTPEEIAADEAFQEKNFGSIRLPTVNRIQSSIFERSFTGPMARKYLASYLIRQTESEDKPLGGGQTLHGRERNFNDVLAK